MPPAQASARILVRARSGEMLRQISASTAIIRGGAIVRKKIPLRPTTVYFRLVMPVGEHAIFVRAPGYYEAARRIRFVPGADPLEQIILESEHTAEFPELTALPDPLRDVFVRSARREGTSPPARFFQALPALKKAAALNILAKMGDTPAGDDGATVLSHVDHVYDFYQDRIYVVLAPGAPLPAMLLASIQKGETRFTVAQSSLHKGFQDASFKTQEDSGRGNLQLSFNAGNAKRVKVDADIDIYTDVLRHLFGEVFRNHLTGMKTNPYRVYQILTGMGIRPEYRLLAADEETA